MYFSEMSTLTFGTFSILSDYYSLMLVSNRLNSGDINTNVFVLVYFYFLTNFD